MKNINHIDKKMLLLCEVMIIAAFICTYMIYGINRDTTGEVCIYDNIVYSEYYGFEMILLIPMIVIIQSQLKSSHRCIVIIRYKNIRRYWNHICKKNILECMFISSVIMANLIGLCIILKITNACGSMCNWELDNSRFRYASGYVMENYPSIIELMIYIFIQMFSILFVTELIIQIVYWLSNNRSVGILVAIIWVCMERYTYITKLMFYRITMMPGEMLRKYGIGVIRCFCYPVTLCLVSYLLSLCIVQKKDIMI